MSAPYDQERDPEEPCSWPEPRECPAAELIARIDAYSMRADRLGRLQMLVNEDPVRAWRRSAFLALGCSSTFAELLSGSSLDTHEFAALVACGCPPETAARILS